jgi:hypothetical protein
MEGKSPKESWEENRKDIEELLDFHRRHLP